MEGQLLGRVTWFNEAKGYGEIISEKNQVFFFTYEQLRPFRGHRSIKRNSIVSFTPIPKRTAFGLPVAGEVKTSKAQLEINFDPSKELPSQI